MIAAVGGQIFGKGSIGFVRFWGKQQLNPKVTQEIGLIVAGTLEAASSHEQEDHWTMNFIASPKVQRRLTLRGMKSSLRIDLDVRFEFSGELVAENQTRNPAIRPLVRKLITDFV